MCTSSGQAAILISVFNITSAGQNIVASASIYGGTINLPCCHYEAHGDRGAVFLPDMTDDEISALFDENTRLMYGETLSNPAMTVFDIERYAKHT